MFLLADVRQKWKYEHVRCRIPGGDDINYVCSVLDEGFNSRRWLRVAGICDFRSERSVLRFWGNSHSMEGLSLSLSNYENSGSIRSTVLSFPAPSPQRLRKTVPEGIQGLWPPSLTLTHTSVFPLFSHTVLMS